MVSVSFFAFSPVNVFPVALLRSTAFFGTKAVAGAGARIKSQARRRILGGDSFANLDFGSVQAMLVCQFGVETIRDFSVDPFQPAHHRRLMYAAGRIAPAL